MGGRGCGADGLELGLEQVLKEAPPPYDPPCPGAVGCRDWVRTRRRRRAPCQLTRCSPIPAGYGAASRLNVDDAEASR